MDVTFLVVPALLVVAGALGLIVIVGLWVKRRKAKAGPLPDDAHGAPSPAGRSSRKDRAARAAETQVDTAQTEQAYASRLARVRAAHPAHNAPAADPYYDSPSVPEHERAPGAEPFGTPDAALQPEPAPQPVSPEPVPAHPDQAESVTAVLRRQVPLRSDQPRSWLGGLPMMPEHIAWPRGVDDQYPERGPIALHFLAQIACADLPADLWGGIGPRDGWLLFFVNPNHFSAEDGDLHRVIHITEIGPERRPPDDCGPVHDKVYTGGSYNWLAAEDVPPVWRRWPVDIVTMANRLTLHEDDGASWKSASPANLSELLYADVPLTERGDAGPAHSLRPMTFGQAHSAVATLAASLRRLPREPIDPEARDALLADGGHAQLIADLEQARMRLCESAPGDLNEGQQRRLAFLDAAIARYAATDADALLGDIASRHEACLVWREKIAGGCDQIAAMLARSDPDTALGDDHWQQLEATFAGKHFDYLELRHFRHRGDGFPASLMSPRETIAIALPRGLDQVAIEYYLDPAHRALLPEGYASAQEPGWRALYNNRPHRMGGFHDGVQSDPIEDPAFGKVLLLQLASDDAMDWCWGDAGAYYFWIRPEDLTAGDFSQVEVWLECH